MRPKPCVLVVTTLLVSALACGVAGGEAEVAAADTPELVPPDDATDAEFPDAHGELSPPTCAACVAYAEPTEVGVLAEGGPLECSGLGASRVHPGVVYAHSDSGDRARFFALAADGSLRGEFRLAPAPFAVDWEDMAVGPCVATPGDRRAVRRPGGEGREQGPRGDAGSCLFLGDVGDGGEARPSYTIYVVPEPAQLDAPEPVDVAWTTLPFRYPDGSHNCETLLVHPQSGDVYLVRKSDVEWGVYRLPTPHTPGVLATLVKVGVVPAPAEWGKATGGDIHPCGDRLLLRSYGSLIELRQPAGQPFDAIFGVQGLPVPVAAETGGEAVAYDADGLGYVTISEGQGVPVHHAGCADE